MAYLVGAKNWASTYVTVAIGKFLWLDSELEKMKKDIREYFKGYSRPKFYGLFISIMMIIAICIEGKFNIAHSFFVIGMILTFVYIVVQFKKIIYSKSSGIKTLVN